MKTPRQESTQTAATRYHPAVAFGRGQAVARVGSACLFLMAAASVPAQLFQQDFSASTNLADYISASTPNNGQWNAISTSGAQVTVTATNHNLSFTRGTGNAGSFSRTTDFSGPPSALICKFDLTVSGNSAAQTAAANWSVGTNFGTANSAEANAKVHSRFALNLTNTPGQFTLRNIGVSNSVAFSGTQNITWVINNSGATLTYLAPDGSQETVADDTADVWAGTTRAIDNVVATGPTNALTDWKFVFDGGSATITMDNFLISTVSVAPPQYLAIQPSGNNAIVTWSNSNWTLLAAPAVTGPYTNVPGATSGYSVPLADPELYFRLTNSAAGP